MSYSPDMSGLELFAAPFRSPHTKAPASRPQQAKATVPQPKAATAVPPMPQPQTVKPEAQGTSSQPVKAKPQMEQPQKPNVPQNLIPDEKNPALQKPQARATEPEPEQNRKGTAGTTEEGTGDGFDGSCDSGREPLGCIRGSKTQSP